MFWAAEPPPAASINNSIRLSTRRDQCCKNALTASQTAGFSEARFHAPPYGTAGDHAHRVAQPCLSTTSPPWHNCHESGNIPSDAVLINANEDPLGPCPEAADAIRAVVVKGGRYNYDMTDGLITTLSELEGVKPPYVSAYAGSSLPLHTFGAGVLLSRRSRYSVYLVIPATRPARARRNSSARK